MTTNEFLKLIKNINKKLAYFLTGSTLVLVRSDSAEETSRRLLRLEFFRICVNNTTPIFLRPKNIRIGGSKGKERTITAQDFE